MEKRVVNFFLVSVLGWTKKLFVRQSGESVDANYEREDADGDM